MTRWLIPIALAALAMAIFTACSVAAGGGGCIG